MRSVGSLEGTQKPRTKGEEATPTEDLPCSLYIQTQGVARVIRQCCCFATILWLKMVGTKCGEVKSSFQKLKRQGRHIIKQRPTRVLKVQSYTKLGHNTLKWLHTILHPLEFLKPQDPKDATCTADRKSESRRCSSWANHPNSSGAVTLPTQDASKSEPRIGRKRKKRGARLVKSRNLSYFIIQHLIFR